MDIWGRAFGQRDQYTGLPMCQDGNVRHMQKEPGASLGEEG